MEFEQEVSSENLPGKPTTGSPSISSKAFNVGEIPVSKKSVITCMERLSLNPIRQSTAAIAFSPNTWNGKGRKVCLSDGLSGRIEGKRRLP